ncbi:hypothetical protein FOQG_08442 [Fusarium oxysporum f. sp. raphani 54005]|uniref:Uncharacterized protein n=7 Tax=Fusarium oxysporum TaxID=5507 RepID=W9IT00_FUSOX|nr:hypothetical protein FOXG_18280 [Fusarium oxysporum f. sp. lycopersici 4287]EWY97812.1 hypothetical protein FOYG_02571 [Fusarium oxysporum NRRL 32931]EXA49163.1 hypothetical protein FOVG_02439 [Fusarium oxysporum f. sp. pisi HDV247]EXK41251.1 hypothetical protein FOMG_04736 [Fusarium oxysporum f. sp. melonis 26406]EXK88667.1 hypothetical protein FOQG_08442 [Fusarium oxysporum f. sp. raphani 54005]EXL83005.1 hypothetical protein FOPG_04039 [Fusarium oxysporum f. sp. conglutinans race 2 54008
MLKRMQVHLSTVDTFNSCSSKQCHHRVSPYPHLACRPTCRNAPSRCIVKQTQVSAGYTYHWTGPTQRTHHRIVFTPKKEKTVARFFGKGGVDCCMMGCTAFDGV